MTKKEKRQIIFNKFGGKCAYCGCKLQKGWHIDELKPIKRNYQYVNGYFLNTETKKKSPVLPLDVTDVRKYKWISPKYVTNGCKYPERLHIDNQMPACPSCNINKHSMSLEEFRKFIENFIISLNRDSTQYKIAKRYGLIQETGKKVVFYFETYKTK